MSGVPSPIRLSDVTLDIQFGGKRVNILREASFDFVPRKMVLIAEARSSVVALLDLLSRRLLPQSGQVRFAGRVSWPIGHTAPFSVAITGTQAVSHLASLYNFDREVALDFLRAEFDAPELLAKKISSWPRLLQTKFMLLMSLVPAFDIYLVDGNLVLPEDVAFTRRFLRLFLERSKDRMVLITARQARVVHLLCEGAVVVQHGKLTYTEDLNAALAISNRLPSLATPRDETEDQTLEDEFLL